MLKRIEGNDAHRVVELARYEIADDGFEVRQLNFRFAVNGARPAKAVDDGVDGLIRTVRHGSFVCSRPLGMGNSDAMEPGFKRGTADSFRPGPTLPSLDAPGAG
jgi:hypothetical protein